MKKLILFLAAIAVFAGGKVSAQGKYGADSAECIKYLSYYQEYYKQKNYDSALPNWRKAYKICPATASQNMFIHGTSLMTRIYSRAATQAEKDAIADTILTLQDQRLQYYPKNKVSILNNKGNYLINYKSGETRYLYDNLNEIIAQLGGQTKSSILVYDLQSAIKLFRDFELSADDVISSYNNVIACIDSATPKNDDEAEQIRKVRTDLETIFADSKVASCENIISIFGPRFEANPDDVALVSTIVKLMNTAEDCINNDLYLRAVTSMHKNDPSYNSAYFLYKLHSSRGNTDEAIAYLEEAIASDGSDAAVDAEYLFELANYCYRNNMRSKAYDNARKVAELGYGFAGKAYFLMGTIWGSTSCKGGNEIQSRSPYWVAVDYMQKAKNADPSLTDEANRYISQFSAYYPTAADAFMYDLTAGQSYTVSCGGLTATTTVRVSNK